MYKSICWAIVVVVLGLLITFLAPIFKLDLQRKHPPPPPKYVTMHVMAGAALLVLSSTLALPTNSDDIAGYQAC